MTTPRPEQGNAAAGFTLVELLVAITLVALLTVVLFGALRFGTRAADAVGARVDRSAQIAVVYDFMQNELADARPLASANDSPQAPLLFTGLADEITFVTTPPAYLALGGFHLLHVALAGSGPIRSLTVAWQPVTRGAATAETTPLQPSVLLDEVRAVEFAYFGVTQANRPPEWQDQWTGRMDLPQLVRVRLRLADGWQAPDLIVAPQLHGTTQP